MPDELKEYDRPSEPERRTVTDELSFRGRQLLDALVYALALTATLFVGVTLVNFVLGGSWIGVKYGLFFVGIALFGLGTFKLRPKAAWKDKERIPADREGKTPFQSAMTRVSPIDPDRIAPDDPLSDGTKLFVAAVLVLLTSFLMEAVLGIKISR